MARPTELVVIAEHVDYGGQLPGAITFGARATGALEVLFRFDPVWRGQGRIEEAFLLLEPAAAGAQSPAPIEVGVWRIEEDWSKSDLTWQSQPSLAHPHALGIAASNGSPLRVDVTHLVRYLKEHPRRDHGLAIRSAALQGTGVSYATGASGGRAPRIEVYSH